MGKLLLLVFLAEILMTAGHVLLKKCSNTFEVNIPFGMAWIIQVAKQPLIWLGLVVLLSGLLFWFWALASGSLSLVFALGSMQYVLSLFAAHYFLNEKIDATKLIGTTFVVIGIVIIALSSGG